MTFKKDDPRTQELARKGGRARVMQRRQRLPPYTGSILTLMDEVGLGEESWDVWRTFWRSVYNLPMDVVDLEAFRRHTARERPPERPVREAWAICGRRAGKSRSAAVAAVFAAISFDSSLLAPGEWGTVPIIASDKAQAHAVFGYIRALFTLPEFAPWLSQKPLRDKILLKTGISIEVSTASFKTIRGRTIITCIADELAFWRTDDGSANPDHEILSAIRPGMLSIPTSLLLVISSPHAAKGELWETHDKYFGMDDDHTLVWVSDSTSMNPALPAADVAKAFERDPTVAGSEFGENGSVLFRVDVQSFLDPLLLRDLIPPGVREIPPEGGVTYSGFTDPSGGSRDSMTLAIAHAHPRTGEVILDCVREVRPPFSPDAVTAEFAGVLARYGIKTVCGDRYGGEWPRERFRRHGIEYEPSELTKSEIYLEVLPVLNARQASLLDLPRLKGQLIALERRTRSGGRDTVDHPRGTHDDIANAVCGALALVAPAVGAGRALIFGGEGRGWLGGKRVEAKRDHHTHWKYSAGGPSTTIRVGKW